MTFVIQHFFPANLLEERLFAKVVQELPPPPAVTTTWQQAVQRVQTALDAALLLSDQV